MKAPIGCISGKLVAAAATSTWAFACCYTSFPRRLVDAPVRDQRLLIGLVAGAIALSVATHWVSRRRSQLMAGAFFVLGLHAALVASLVHRLWVHRPWTSYHDVLTEPAYYLRRFAGIQLASPPAAWVHYGLTVTAALFIALASADLATRSRQTRLFSLAHFAVALVTTPLIARLLWTRSSLVAVAGLGASMCAQIVVVACFGTRRADLRATSSLIACTTLAWLGVDAGIRARALDCIVTGS